jgi:hypothetical protein
MPAASRVTLLYSATAGLVELRELTGRDEVSVERTGTSDAVRLLNGLLAASPIPASRLAAPDRDRVLAALYRMTFGSRIATTLTCGRCDQRYDLDFSLDRLSAAVDDHRGPVVREPDGTFRTEGGSFRYPTAEDELAAAGTGSMAEARAELVRRCAGASPASPEALFAAMEAAAPLHDLELEATCPECRSADTLRFDIQHYLLASLIAERPRVLRDFHRLARAYGWSLREILELSRSQRHRLVELIEQEAA